MNAKERFECNGCGELHKDLEDARDCCPVEIFERFVCGECAAPFDDQESAEACCRDESGECCYDPLKAPLSAEERAANLTLF